ncbi:glycosyltransferase [Metabacillus sp. cB07]|uniref:glycosyltransferase n=1 Tax=Metabacillus sp. cB07 TaxID=2806989 RepID=UPI001939D553|nr:glycosyltransferase [Metabacillus sp. cB07]
MKKTILFVIDSLTIGGAEKSLVSLLKTINAENYSIDLLQIKRGGDLERFVPEHITLLPEPEYFKNTHNLKYKFSRIKTSILLRTNEYRTNPLHTEQIVYKSIQNLIQPLKKTYDLAIAYSQGMPTYIVANKVNAARKIAWINTDYTNTLYDKEFDFHSYSKIDKIVAVSDHIKTSVSNLRKEYQHKIDIIFDIVDPVLINKMANEGTAEEYEYDKTNILTVGRLVEAKGYTKAIQVAKKLKENGIKFKWFVIGDGPERMKLQKMIVSNHLENHFFLLGKRLNPYIYMNMCDLYIQPSLKEGFGLTVCEAKILKKPIICTNFSTASEIINSGQDGLIVEHDVKSIYDGITKFLNDNNFKMKILNQLESTAVYSSVSELNKFYSLLEN